MAEFHIFRLDAAKKGNNSSLFSVEELLRQTGRTDMRSRERLRDLLTANMDLMFSYALLITGRRDRALDLMQETIVSLLSKEGEIYEEREAFRSWIFRVLRNNWINHLAKPSFSRETPFSDFAEEQERPFGERLMTAAEPEREDPLLRDRLLAAFAELPAEQQEVCVCVDVEGLSYEETARRLGIPIGTVMSRLHRGRSALQARLFPAATEWRIIPFSKEVHHGRRSAV